MLTSRARTWLLVLATTPIVVATLLPGGGGGSSQLCIFCGDRGLADFVSNILLFVPLGAAIALRGSSLARTTLAGALLSLIIEAAQLQLVTGRDANVGDLLANATGAGVGWCALRARPWRLVHRAGSTAMHAFVLGTVAALVAVLASFLPARWQPPYRLYWTPLFENHDMYRGEVLHMRLDAHSWTFAPAPVEPADSAERMLRRLDLQLRLLAAPATARLAPIIAVVDAEREVVLLAAHHDEFVVRYWSVAEELGLDKGDLRIPRVFGAAAIGDTIDLRLVHDVRGYCIDVNGAARCAPGLSVGDTWTVLLSPDWRSPARRAAGVAWIWFIFVPCGLAAGGRRALAVGAVAALGYLIIGPLLAGFASTPLPELAAALAGLGTGYLIARASARRTRAAAFADVPAYAGHSAHTSIP